ncbi:MAG: tRNA (adenosine(37)-N6)-threonylcarbamoyltransferase complex ATPase subunit type 1 TsaE [Nitrospirae bacterium]|nr:MAG: tRNA (adenosine(37)-N6)-threonylcarbamoyltransferase complex ATPase subunit type 1 TsaE [Nitrospirota bacterium]
MTTNPARLAEKVGSAVAWETTSAAETHALGKALGEACIGREVVALVGPLGAGKTCLVRGIAEGLGVPMIEWADKAPGVLPRDHLWITLDHLGGDRRRVALHPRGARSTELATRATARLAKQPRTESA